MSPAESIQLHLNAAYSLSHGRRCPSGSEAASHAFAIVYNIRLGKGRVWSSNDTMFCVDFMRINCVNV